MNLAPTFQSWNCEQQRVFLRADLNVPLIDGKISNDRRLVAILPTLDALLGKKAQIVLATHIGRPNDHESTLSTQHLIPWFIARGYKIFFAPTIQAAQETLFEQKSVILLENLRFFPGEKKIENLFIGQLRTLANWYVLDAFGTLHREDASLAPLANTFAPNHRSIGLLVQKELSVLNELKKNPKRPTCYILGGGKAADKIPLIDSLIPVADTLFICPALAFTFLKAQGTPVGKSLVDNQAISSIESILDKAKSHNTTVLFPLDYQVAKGSLEGPLSYCNANAIPEDGIGLSIGPKTINLIEKIIAQSKTVFYNGMMGLTNRQDTLGGVKAVIRAMAKSNDITIVAGGNSIDIIDQLGLKGITHIMTGGGSTVTYLAGQPLPALEPFLIDRAESD